MGSNEGNRLPREEHEIRQPMIYESDLANGISVQQEPEKPILALAQGLKDFTPKAGILIEELYSPPMKLTHSEAIRLSFPKHAGIWRVSLCLQS